jgi:hypothetical protein
LVLQRISIEGLRSTEIQKQNGKKPLKVERFGFTI